MCGRYTFTMSPKELEDHFDALGVENFPQRFNVAPAQ